MSSPVKLYVYDLSNGLARQLSLQLTGRQIDGIWHTSIVVFGKEVFYGQGISTTNPGQSHHGQPLQVIDMGETAIDEETFNDYINEMNDVYTADKYHLLDFNCNSFTDDCIGFLTGGSIPSWIKDLPSDFLSTPFGAALRPTIDNMYRRPTPGVAAAAGASTAPPPQTFNTPLASSLLQSVASQAGGSGAGSGQASNLNSNSGSRSNGYPAPTPVTPQPETNTVAAPLQVCSNQQHFNSILGSHRGVVAFFTSRTCPPCRVVEPVFEEIALNKASSVGSRAGGGNGGVGEGAGKGGIAFVKVDLGGGGILGGGGQVVASTYGVRVTPTFLFFVDGRKVYELKGADVGELRTQIDLLVYQIFPPHPHTKKNLKAIRSLSLDPILFEKVPPLDQVQTKLFSFIESIESGQDVNSNSNPNSGLDAEKVKKALSTIIIPFLKTQMHEKVRGAAGGGGGGGSSSRINTLKPLAAATIRRVCEEWVGVTEWVGRVLVAGESRAGVGVGGKEEGVFPLIDLWRVGLLDRSVSRWCAALWVDGQGRGQGKGKGGMINPILMFLENATKERGNGEGVASVPKNVLLTTLRLVTNAFGNVVLARALLLGGVQGRGQGTREKITRLVVGGLLSEDSGVRSAAASLAFNVSAFYQRARVEGVRGGSGSSGGGGAGGASDVAEGEEEGDWEVEMVSAVVEALRNEKASEDVVHRLVASLAFFLHLSPVYESHLEPLLEVLQVKDILRAKLRGAVAGNEEGGFGEKGVGKKEVRVLIEEVAGELCS